MLHKKCSTQKTVTNLIFESYKIFVIIYILFIHLFIVYIYKTNLMFNGECINSINLLLIVNLLDLIHLKFRLQTLQREKLILIFPFKNY